MQRPLYIKSGIEQKREYLPYQESPGQQSSYYDDHLRYDALVSTDGSLQPSELHAGQRNYDNWAKYGDAVPPPIDYPPMSVAAGPASPCNSDSNHGELEHFQLHSSGLQAMSTLGFARNYTRDHYAGYTNDYNSNSSNFPYAGGPRFQPAELNFSTNTTRMNRGYIPGGYDQRNAFSTKYPPPTPVSVHNAFTTDYSPPTPMSSHNPFAADYSPPTPMSAHTYEGQTSEHLPSPHRDNYARKPRVRRTAITDPRPPKAFHKLPGFQSRRNCYSLLDCFPDCRKRRYGVLGVDRRGNLLEHLRNYHGQDIPKGGSKIM